MKRAWGLHFPRRTNDLRLSVCGINPAGQFGIPDNYNRDTVLQYLATTNGRYLTGNKRIKPLKVKFTGNEGIELYKTFNLTEAGVTSKYWISGISNINLQEYSCEIEGTLI